MTGHRSVDAKVAEGDERTTMAKRVQRNGRKGTRGKTRAGKNYEVSMQMPVTGRCFFHRTRYAVPAVDFPIISSRLFDQFADEVAIGEDDRGAAGLSGSLQAQQFTALPPDEYGTSGS